MELRLPLRAECCWQTRVGDCCGASVAPATTSANQIKRERVYVASRFAAQLATLAAGRTRVANCDCDSLPVARNWHARRTRGEENTKNCDLSKLFCMHDGCLLMPAVPLVRWSNQLARGQLRHPRREREREGATMMLAPVATNLHQKSSLPLFGIVCEQVFRGERERERESWHAMNTRLASASCVRALATSGPRTLFAPYKWRQRPTV